MRWIRTHSAHALTLLRTGWAWCGKEVIFSVFVTLAFFLVQNHMDNKESDREDRLEATRASHDEVVSNVQFIRETVRDHPDGPKNFRAMNLRGADLSGLDLGCDIRIGEPVRNTSIWQPTRPATCADFTGSDLTGAKFNGADLTGALFDHAKLDKVNAGIVVAPAVDIKSSSMRGSKIGGVLFGANLASDAGPFKVDGAVLDGASIFDTRPRIVTDTSLIATSIRSGNLPCAGPIAYKHGPRDPWHKMARWRWKRGLVMCNSTTGEFDYEAPTDAPERIGHKLPQFLPYLDGITTLDPQSAGLANDPDILHHVKSSDLGAFYDWLFATRPVSVGANLIADPPEKGGGIGIEGPTHP